MTLTSRDYLNDPFFLGFDRIFNRLDTMDIANRAKGNYPPYNVHKRKDDYVIELAVAGFEESDIGITVQDHKLTVEGKREETETSDEKEGHFHCIHRGIGKRNFKLTWNLADTIQVKDAEMHNGILAIYLVNEIPEEKKPKQIEIGRAQAGFFDNVKKKLLTEKAA